jgi:hypothetical protein
MEARLAALENGQRISGAAQNSRTTRLRKHVVVSPEKTWGYV